MSDDATETEAPATDRPETLDEALGNGTIGDDVEAALAAEAGGGSPAAENPETPVEPLQYEQLTSSETGAASVRDLGLIADVDVVVAVEFGRVDVPIRQILQIRRGSLLELHRRPEAQVTVLANGKPIALGDIVVVDGQVGVHIVELLDPESAAAPIAPPAQVILGERGAGDEDDPTEGDAEAEGTDEPDGAG